MSFADTIVAYTDEALEAVSSKGLLRRAMRDLDKGIGSIEAQDEHGAAVNVDGNTVKLDAGGLPAAACTCPADGVCRHKVFAVLLLRRAQGKAQTASAPSMPSALDALCTLPQATLEKFAGKDWVKALALRDEEGEITHTPPNVCVTFPAFDARVDFLATHPLKEAVYKGAASRRRLLITLAAVRLRGTQGISIEEHAAEASSPRTLSERFVDKARQVILQSVAAVVPSRSPTAHDLLLDLAVSSRVESLPRLAQELRTLATMARQASERTITFEATTFLRKAARTMALLHALAGEGGSERYGGQLRRAYTHRGPLVLWPLGVARWRFARGLTVYAYAPASNRWHAVSEGRAAGMDPSFEPHNRYEAPLWGAGIVRDLVGATIALEDARVADDGTLALEQADSVVVTPERLSADTLHETLGAFTQWPLLRQDLADRIGHGLTRCEHSVPALIAPSGYGAIRFNDLAQCYEWEIKDASGELLRLTLAGNDHECALRLPQLARKIQAILVEVALEADTLVFRPVTVFTGKRAAIAAFNLHFDHWPVRERTHEIMEKLMASLAASPAPTFDAPDPLAQLLEETADAIFSTLGYGSGPDLTALSERYVTVGLGSLARAVRRFAADPSTEHALKAAYLVDEIYASLNYQ